jgi:hypothetical protein
MADTRPTGFTTVRSGKRGGRSFYAYWRDAEGRHGRCLGPAHVRDSGRKTARGAVIWRAGDGPLPTPDHLAPKDAAAELRAILASAPQAAEERPAGQTLQDAAEAWMLSATRIEV